MTNRQNLCLKLHACGHVIETSAVIGRTFSKADLVLLSVRDYFLAAGNEQKLPLVKDSRGNNLLLESK